MDFFFLTPDNHTLQVIFSWFNLGIPGEAQVDT